MLVFSGVEMVLSVILLGFEAICGLALVLGAHIIRRRFGLVPFFACLGFATAIMWLVTYTGLRVEVAGISFLVGSAVFFTSVLLGAFIVYVIDGPAVGRMAIAVVVIMSTILHVVQAVVGYHFNLVDPLTEPVLYQPSLRMFLASMFALLVDLAFLGIAWEYMGRIQRWIGLGGRVFVTLLGVMWLDVLVFVPGAFWGNPAFGSILEGNLVSRLVISVFAAAVIWVYFQYERKRYGHRFEVRSPLAIFKSPSVEHELLVLRRRAQLDEQVLRSTEQRYQAIFENANDAVLILCADVFIDCNQQALALFAGTRDEIVGRSPFELSPELQPDGSSSRTKADRILANAWTGQPQRFEWQHQRLDGSVFDAEISLNSFELAEEKLLLVFIRDVTRQKRAQAEQRKLESQLRQAQKLEAIGVLAGGVAHDFNNVLFGILGYSDLALESLPPDHQATDYLREIITAGKRASDLVKQILTFARRQERILAPIDLVPLLKEAFKLVRSTLPANINIEQQLQTEQAVVVADPTEIHQVLMNLCTNAAHSMEENGGTLTLGLRLIEVDADMASLHHGLCPGNYTMLSVSDTGHGIAAEILERIFEPFYTTKERGEGTGMGLAVVHGIIVDLGGTITVYSEPGQGTTFNVYIPESPVDRMEKPLMVSKLPRGTEHVLVVDDEPALTQMLSAMLCSLGYRVTAYNSSREALAEFERNGVRFDIVLTDQSMPEMTGSQLSQRMLAIHPEARIVLCTGFSKTIDEQQAKGIGIRRFLLKPLTRSTLARAIRETLDA
ncbi:response regulator [bacterium]|nr:response regulator [bacterium]